MFDIEVLSQDEKRLFLGQVIEKGSETQTLSHTRLDEIHQNLAALAHKLIAVRADSFSSAAVIRNQVAEAFTLTSIGLEYASETRIEKALRLLNRNPVIKFFQIGNTLLQQLLDRAQETLENAVIGMTQTEAQDFSEHEVLPVYNEWEQRFLESLQAKKLVIDASQIALKGVSSEPRRLTSLTEVHIANQQMDYIEQRSHYMQALPQDKIFAAEHIPDTDGDYARQITTALMVNLMLYREVDFHLDTQDLDHVFDIAYDIANRSIKKPFQDVLNGWIRHYMDVTARPEEVKQYAMEYWRHCLRLLEETLQSREDFEAVDVLRA